MKNATPTETANYITNTGCDWEMNRDLNGGWDTPFATWETPQWCVDSGFPIRIALTPFGLPSHLPPHNPAGLSAEQITEGGYRAVTDEEPSFDEAQFWKRGKWVAVTEVDLDNTEDITARLPADTPFPDWEEMSKAVVKESSTPQPAPGETPEEKTCGELSCDECNDRYSRIRDQRDNLLKMLEAAEAENVALRNERDQARDELAAEKQHSAFLEAERQRLKEGWKQAYRDGNTTFEQSCKNLQRAEKAETELANLQAQMQKEGRGDYAAGRVPEMREEIKTLQEQRGILEAEVTAANADRVRLSGALRKILDKAAALCDAEKLDSVLKIEAPKDIRRMASEALSTPPSPVKP